MKDAINIYIYNPMIGRYQFYRTTYAYDKLITARSEMAKILGIGIGAIKAKWAE